MVNCIDVVVVVVVVDAAADRFVYLVVNWVQDNNDSVVAHIVDGVLVDGGVLVDVVDVAADVAVAAAAALVVAVAVVEFRKVNGAFVNFVPVVDYAVLRVDDTT